MIRNYWKRHPDCGWVGFPLPPRKPVMREEERIDRILSLVRDYWKEHPEMRLTQIIVNVVKGNREDIFYTEDEEVEASLRKLLKKL
jgi:hypothetical protein